MANYTRNAILTSFASMLDRMPFDKITVTSLIRECGVGRNTFYYHYVDIYALLDDWIEVELGRYEEASQDQDWKDALKMFLNYCRENKVRVYHIYHSLSRERIDRYLLGRTVHQINRFVRRWSKDNDVLPARLQNVSDLCRYALYGFFMSFLLDDMRADTDAAIDELADLFEDVLRMSLQ